MPQERLATGHAMTHTEQEKVRGRGQWWQSESAQASNEVVFGLRYLCQTVRQVGRVLQGGDASRLGQGVDTPGRPGAPVKSDRSKRRCGEERPRSRIRIGHLTLQSSHQSHKLVRLT